MSPQVVTRDIIACLVWFCPTHTLTAGLMDEHSTSTATPPSHQVLTLQSEKLIKVSKLKGPMRSLTQDEIAGTQDKPIPAGDAEAKALQKSYSAHPSPAYREAIAGPKPSAKAK